MYGYFWVVVFFILSGFVLPLRFFQTFKESCIYGGTFRRYLRLMLPVLVTLSLYYFVVKMGWTHKKKFIQVKRKNFLHFLEDSLIGTWLNSNDYTIATWTLSIELFASFFIYLLS